MSAYSDYLTDLQRLLHDSSNQFWTEPEKIDYINRARDRVVRDTGCYRILQTNYLAPGLEVYPFGGVTGCLITAGGSGYVGAPGVTFTGGGGTGAAGTAVLTSGVVTSITITATGSGYTSAPAVGFASGAAAATAGIINAASFDVVNTTVWWGNSRTVLRYMAWSRFNALMRYYTNYTGVPAVFSVYSYNSLYIQPLPSQLYQAEMDTVWQPPTIVDTTTVEVIPFPFRSPVAFYAAYLAKMKEQSWGEANQFFEQYNRQIMSSLNSAFTRRLANPYQTR